MILVLSMDISVAFTILLVATLNHQMEFATGIGLCKFAQTVADLKEAEKREWPSTTDHRGTTSSSTLPLSDDIISKQTKTEGYRKISDQTTAEEYKVSDTLDYTLKTEKAGASMTMSFPTSSNHTLPYYESACPPNTVNASCTCQVTCADPNACYDNCIESTACICPDGFSIRGTDCISTTECGCFMEGTGVIPENETYVSGDCSVQCSCNDDRLTCNFDYKCSSDATCIVKDQVRQCYCNDGFEGDGEICRKVFTDCYDAYEVGFAQNGLFTIHPSNWTGSSFDVYCDMTSGGWTVFQRRIDGVTDFFQPWDTYKEGFGSLTGEFWLGNEKLHYLTNQREYRLRIDIVISGNFPIYSEYSSFRIDNETNYYKIVDIGTRSGNAGDGMDSTKGRRFSTYDREEVCSSFNCPENHRGAWWYASDWCNKDYFFSNCALFRDGSRTSCTYANLNGDYAGGDGQNVFWDIPGTSYYCYLISTEMKIRPNN